MELTYRNAQKSDLPLLVAMLADDILGAEREDISSPLNGRYIEAFEQIHRDPNNELVVAEIDGTIVGMLQLTFIPSLSYIGTWRCLIEGVRIHAHHRGQGLGHQLFAYAIQRARVRECKMVQLTTNKQRIDAHRFYENLGFVASHEGYKLAL